VLEADIERIDTIAADYVRALPIARGARVT
jgi:hypothetical protein